MDSDQIARSVRARFEHNLARQITKEKYQAKMLFAHAGGMWRAGPELLTLLQACAAKDDLVMEDLYGNPVKVNVLELRNLALDRWQEQMNAWLIEHAAISQQR